MVCMTFAAQIGHLTDSEWAYGYRLRLILCEDEPAIVRPDCTASHAESDGSHYDYVVAPHGNTVTWIETDPGTVVSGTEVQLKSPGSE